MSDTGNIEQAAERRRGVVYGLSAYAIWGCFPLFFALFQGVPSWEVLVHRIIWSCVFLAILISGLKRWAPIREALRHPAELGYVLACAVLIAANWGIFIYAVEVRQVFQSSLGYFLTPIVNVSLGMIFLRERLNLLQGLAVALSGFAIVLQFAWLGQVPWIALMLALTFGTYGLVRKKVLLDGLSGLFVETLLLLPLGLLAFAWLFAGGTSNFGDSPLQTGLLMVSGIVTAVPLMLFAGATRRLRLATVGFLMYINPTMQFLTAWLVFGESMSSVQLLSFGLIWLALAIYSWASFNPGTTVGRA